MGISIKKLLNGMLKVGASDLHLKVGQQPVIRLNGTLRAVDEDPLTERDTKRINEEIMPERCRSTFEKRGSVDYSYSMSTMKRFRINAYHQRGAVSIAVRPIVAKSLTIDELIAKRDTHPA